MELTQRLQCSQELYSNICEKSSSEQIGFLGICGSKYPLKKGPNKIGRDPETCNIVLNLNSISRQHAVINILNSQDFMLMDLDSANKTKLSDRTLQPYIPHLLKNGDMVQFGDVFGVFRLLQEDNDLPMTQAIDIPETPITHRHISKLNIHATIIPESPEVSDKDDSFIGTSQSKPKNVFKSPNNNFLKSSGKTIAIKPIGTNKIDNIFWSSSKKSDSFSTQSNISANLYDSVASHPINQPCANEKSIHEMDTQISCANGNESNDSIYNANTQIVNSSSPNIFEMETQLPIADNLPQVCKIHDQENLKINFNTDNKENDNFNMHNAETQVIFKDKPTTSKENIFNAEKQVIIDHTIIPRVNVNETNKSILSSPNNVSDDIILFDEIESPPLEDNFESQQLLSPKINFDKQSDEDDENIPQSQINFIPQKRKNRIESNISTDCEDINIAVSQIIPRVNIDEDLTDCEDETDTVFTKKEKRKSSDMDEDETDCEDANDDDMIKPNRVVEDEKIEDLPTQILKVTEIDAETTKNISLNDNFEDLPTQIIEETTQIIEENENTDRTQLFNHEPIKGTSFEEALTQQIYSEEVVRFKVPFQTPVKLSKKKKIDTNITIKPSKSSAIIEIVDEDDEKYYAATQELFDDLCSQRPASPDVKIVKIDEKQSLIDKISGIKGIPRSSSESSDNEEKIKEFVSNLTCSQIEDVVGVKKDEDLLKNVPSDGSDLVNTPKKINCLSLLEIDLPSTQEIKTGISLIRDSDTESFTDNHSDSDKDSECDSPVKFKRKLPIRQKIRINLSDKFDPDSIPVRTSSRMRKPTSKIQNCDESFQCIADNKIKPILIKKKDITEYAQSSKESTSRLRKGKSNKDKTEKPVQLNSAMDRHNSGGDNHLKLETQNSEKNQPKRGRKAKQKDEKNIDKRIPKITEIVTEECNEKKKSNSTGRKSRFKQKKEETPRKDSSNNRIDRSMTPEKKKSSSDVRNKNKRKPTNEISTSMEEENDKNISIESSKSPETATKRKTERDRSRSTETDSKTKTSKEKSISPEIGIKRKPSKGRTRSPGDKQKNTTKGRPRSLEVGRNVQTTKSSEKSVVLKSEEAEVRRSKRNKRNKTKSSEEPIISTVTKPAYEQSRVYSNASVISPDSGTDSPKNLKRTATCEIDLPKAKKPRGGLNSNKSILRSTSARKAKTQHVLFTAFACDEVKDKLEKLGAIIVSDVKSCTVVMTMQIKRTFKLLCAVGLGKPIVGPNWVQACADTNMIVDPWLYLLQDEATERRFKFNLQQSLVGKRNFLKGYNVSSTPSVMPSPPEMKQIVECSGGKWKEGGSHWICVSALADRELWAGLKQKGAVVVSTEFILGGVMRQTLDIQRYIL